MYIDEITIKAFYIGLISAVSLPLGAIIARFWTPRPRITAMLMAFGGGALLAALTIDLVAESVNKRHFTPLFIGCIIGGVLYEILNQAINNKGGFLRKASTTMNHLKILKRRQFSVVFRKLSHLPVFHELQEDEIHELIDVVKPLHLKAGHHIVKQGDPAETFYIIIKGIIDVYVDNVKVASLGKEEIFGEVEVIKGIPHPLAITAATDLDLYCIKRSDFLRLLNKFPHFASEVKKFITQTKDEIKGKKGLDFDKADDWLGQAMHHVEEDIPAPTTVEIKHAVTSTGSAVLGIWLGIFLDGIPESMVIGASLLNSAGGHAAISLSLIGGLFLSNFPEALSSSVGMRENGYSYRKIFFMWFSLMLFTGIGSFLGSIFFEGTSESMFVLIKATAAGAMLTMIAETMLPEAFHKGGFITGLSTLGGFLAAIAMKMLE